MRHLYDRAHLNRTAAHRHALLSNMSASLFLKKRVITTLAKAKYARRFAERMITFARRGDLAARRHVSRYVRNPEAVKKLFDELGAHYKNRAGGYTRIIRLGSRTGDAAPMALLELVGFDDLAAAATPKKEGKSRLKGSKKEETRPEKPKRRATRKTKAETAAEDSAVKEKTARDAGE